ncbi:hypothetical protein DPMN_193142 [Dreissena polymorpha]|uniref:Uncharacterized protein n=1 Tax=Dreissena polymorpha TaxID=45954 RepID=A0A9D3Y2N2_DREPO|nr:hypothetical protein DPMN_193142 [Dreissena polymorpha]
MTASVFHVVSFDGKDSVAIVPHIWLHENGCWWPPYKGLKWLQIAVEKEEMPSENWTQHSCPVLYTGSFMEAVKRVRKAKRRQIFSHVKKTSQPKDCAT